MIWIFLLSAIPYGKAAPFVIIAQEQQYLTYQVQMGESITYQRFLLSQLTENETAIIINYTYWTNQSSLDFLPDQANTTLVNLTGQIENDLFFGYGFNPIIPLGVNFSVVEEDLQGLLQNLMGNVEIEMQIHVNTSLAGYGIDFAIYVRFLLMFKVMELKAVYSTTGVLLQSLFWVKNPSTFKSITGITRILPVESTVAGADQDPNNPLNSNYSTSTGTNSSFPWSNSGTESSNPAFLWDAKSIGVIIVGGVLVSGGITGIYFLVRFRKRRLSKI